MKTKAALLASRIEEKDSHRNVYQELDKSVKKRLGEIKETGQTVKRRK